MRNKIETSLPDPMNPESVLGLSSEDVSADKIGQVEFVALMAFMISLTALAIDAILPAMEKIGSDLGSLHPNDNQLVISCLFLGFAIGQLFFGPLSDSTGRKPAIFLGLLLFMVGCVQSYFSADFSAMLVGRFLQGMGTASTRTVSSALVRDLYSGPRMARMMSLIMTVFILVPVVAPALGQGILLISHWRTIFGLLLVLAAVVLVWFSLRQPETVPQEKRQPFSLKRIGLAVQITCRHRITMGYAITSGMVFGAFSGYLISSQQVLQKQYGLAGQFPLYFGLLALCVGAASLTNARLVMLLGMYRLAIMALSLLSVISIGVLGYLQVYTADLTLIGFMLWAGISLFCIGILFGNLTALAMEPMGDQAGVAASVVGFLSSFIAIILGTWIGQVYNGTVVPMISGFALLGMASLAVVYRTERGRIDSVS